LNTFFAPRFRLPWFLIILATLNAAIWTVMRWSYENNMNTAQLTVDYDETRIFADAFKVPHAKLLRDLKQAGVSSVGVYNLSLANVRDNGRISQLTREEAERMYPSLPWKRFVPAYRTIVAAVPQNRKMTQQIFDHLKAQAQPSLPPVLVLASATAETGRTPVASGTVHDLILLPFSKQLFNDAQVGFDPAHIKAVKDAGMTVTARIGNPINLDLARLRSILDDVEKQTDARVVIFSEDEVFGYDTMIKAASLELRQRNLLFGNIEFTKQRGWQEFAKQTEGRLVRVHSVGGDEAAKVKSEVLIERFSRAVKERNIRVAYMRLARQFKGEVEFAPNPNGNLGELTATQKRSGLEQNLNFISTVSGKLKTQPLPFAWLRPGLKMGPASEFGNYPLSYLAPRFGDGIAKLLITIGAFLTGLGAVGMVLLMLNLFFDLSWQAKMWWTLIGLAIVAFLCRSPGMGAKLIGLVIGCLTPVVAILWGGLPRLWFVGEGDALDSRLARRPPLGQVIMIGLGVLVRTSVLCMLGGMLIVAVMDNWMYFSKADEFLGEKATQLLPLILIALAFAGEIFPERVVETGANRAHRRLITNVNSALDHPVTTRMVVIGLALLVAGFVWIARTGNESGMEISNFELKMRAALERIFVTRPRTKEVFLGHPAIFFAVWFMFRRQWLPAFAFVVAVTIGQADLLNTACHLHTPIFYSLLRSVHAVWLGGLIGAIALWLYAKASHPRIFSASNLDVKPLPGHGGTPGPEKEDETVERVGMREWKGEP